MAQGGAGKVYFVLYLAVILELLIIIVERDEAEEHLIQKQKETMRIVESILSQLQTGAGSEGISTKPKDEITLQEVKMGDGPEIRQDREYEIEVGVTDISGHEDLDPTKEDYHEKYRTNIRLANVEELEYQIFFHPSLDPEQSPTFPSSDSLELINLNEEGQIIGDEIDGDYWRLQMVRRLELDTGATHSWEEPMYSDFTHAIGDLSAHAPPEAIKADSVFWYDQNSTMELAAKDDNKLKKRVFVVRFQAPQKPGWYKLRFGSRTNKILGLGGADADMLTIDAVPDDAKVNIGTVQLKVKELKTVHKELTKRLEGLGVPSAEMLFEAHGDEVAVRQVAAEYDRQLEEAKDRVSERRVAGEFDDDNEATRLMSQIDLYGYIGKLLAPNMSDFFQQNQGTKEIDIRVIKPPMNIADPYVDLPPEGVFYFDKLRPAFTFTSGPFQGNNVPTGIILTASGQQIPLSIEPIGAVADAGSASESVRGGKKLYKAIADRTLEPGNYTIQVVQKNASKVKEEVTPLEVYPTGLTQDSKNDLDFKMNSLYYGYALTVEATPTSEGKIPANQFRTYAGLNSLEQTAPTYGLSQIMKIPASAKTASLRITWISPYTNEEVDLYPAATKTINQEPPSFDFTRVTTKTSGTSTKKFTLSLRDIRVVPAIVDTSAVTSKPDELSMPEVGEITASLAPDFQPTESYVEDQGDGMYTVNINFEGDLGRDEEISGYVDISLSTTVRNSINGVTSSPAVGTFNVTISHEVARTRGGGPAGRRPPPRRR